MNETPNTTLCEDMQEQMYQLSGITIVVSSVFPENGEDMRNVIARLVKADIEDAKNS
jgi:hypothetical protein